MKGQIIWIIDKNKNACVTINLIKHKHHKYYQENIVQGCTSDQIKRGVIYKTMQAVWENRYRTFNTSAPSSSFMSTPKDGRALTTSVFCVG